MAGDLPSRSGSEAAGWRRRTRRVADQPSVAAFRPSRRESGRIVNDRRPRLGREPRGRRLNREPSEAFRPIPRNVGAVLDKGSALLEVLVCADDLKFSGSSGSSGSGAAKVLIYLAVSIEPVRNHFDFGSGSGDRGGGRRGTTGTTASSEVVPSVRSLKPLTTLLFSSPEPLEPLEPLKSRWL